MSQIEEAFLRRFTGKKIVFWSIGFGIVGVAPLLLYILFGPADGNPIGLGLLAVFTIPVAAVGVFVGVIMMLVQYFSYREK